MFLYPEPIFKPFKVSDSFSYVYSVPGVCSVPYIPGTQQSSGVTGIYNVITGWVEVLVVSVFAVNYPLLKIMVIIIGSNHFYEEPRVP